MAILDLLKFWDIYEKQPKTSPELWEEIKNEIIADHGTPAQNELSDWDFFVDRARDYALDKVERGFGDPRTKEHAVNLFDLKNVLLVNEYTNYYQDMGDIFFGDMGQFSFQSAFEEILVDMIYECVIINARTYGGIE